MFRSAAKETLAFGHVFGNVSFWQCISQGRSDTNKTATHVDNMLISVSVCGKRALGELWTLDVRLFVYQSIFGRAADRFAF